MTEDTSQLKAFDAVQADVAAFITPSLELTVGTDETARRAQHAVKQVKIYRDAIEERRKALVAPLNAQVKMINDYAKTLQEPVQRAEGHLKGELIVWERKLEAQRRETAQKIEDKRRAAEEERIREEAEAKAVEERNARKRARERELAAGFGPDVVLKSPTPPPPAVQPAAAVDRARFEKEKELAHAERANQDNRVKGIARHWTFEVTDSQKVPREFLLVNEPGLRRAVLNGEREIPGVRIYQEERMTVR